MRAANLLLGNVELPKFLRSTMVLAGGNAAAQAVPILLTPFLARIYSPAELGTLALFLAFLSFAVTANSLRYEFAIPAAETDREAANLAVLCLLLLGPLSIVGASALLILSSRSVLGLDALQDWMAIAMFASLVISGVFTAFRYWLVRTGEFAQISMATVQQSVVRTAGQIVLGIANGGVAGLVVAESAGRFASIRKMAQQAWRGIRALALPIDHFALSSVAKKYRSFPMYMVPSSLINSLAVVLPVPMITTFYGVALAGQYSMASRALLLPFALIGTSVGDVFHNRFAKSARENPGAASRLFFRVAAVLFGIGLIPMMTVWFFGEDIWSILLGDEWVTAGSIASAISPWALAQFVVNPLSRVVLVYQAQRLKLVYDVVTLIAVAGSLILCHNYNLSFIATMKVLGMSQAVAYGFYFCLLVKTVRDGETWRRVTGDSAS